LRILAAKPEAFRRAVRVVAAVGAFQGGYALVCFFSNLMFGTDFGVEIDQYGAFPGTYGTMYEANLLGAYSAACLILIIVLYLKERRRILLVAGALTYAGLLISLSRAAIIASIVALAVLGFVGFRTGLVGWRSGKRIGVALLTVSLILSPVVVPLYIERFSTVQVSDVTADADTAVRVVTIAMAIDDIVQHPIFGNGTSSFQLLVSSRELGFGADVDETGTWIGNAEVRILHDTGLIGLTVFVWFLLSLLIAAWKRLQKQWNTELLGLVLSAFVYCLTFQTTEGTLLAFSWVHLGLIANAVSIPQTSKVSERPALANEGGLAG
jgi:O-antigen ligase